MAGLGLSSPAEMRSYPLRRADATTLAALQPSGLVEDVWVGFQIPPRLLASLVAGWQERLREA
eukprot:7385731-Alexandrium_andersonii.AAC.1